MSGTHPVILNEMSKFSQRSFFLTHLEEKKLVVLLLLKNTTTDFSPGMGLINVLFKMLYSKFTILLRDFMSMM